MGSNTLNMMRILVILVTILPHITETLEKTAVNRRINKIYMNYPVDKFFPLNICNQAEGTMNTESVANESTITRGEEGHTFTFLEISSPIKTSSEGLQILDLLFVFSPLDLKYWENIDQVLGNGCNPILISSGMESQPGT